MIASNDLWGILNKWHYVLNFNYNLYFESLIEQIKFFQKNNV